MEWCASPDRGLPAPDAVLYLDLPIEAAMLRGQFGDERYEKEEFQRKVAKNFKLLMAKDGTTSSVAGGALANSDEETPWHILDASKGMDELHSEIKTLALAAVERAKLEPLRKLWVKEPGV